MKAVFRQSPWVPGTFSKTLPLFRFSALCLPLRTSFGGSYLTLKSGGHTSLLTKTWHFFTLIASDTNMLDA